MKKFRCPYCGGRLVAANMFEASQACPDEPQLYRNWKPIMPKAEFDDGVTCLSCGRFHEVCVNARKTGKVSLCCCGAYFEHGVPGMHLRGDTRHLSISESGIVSEE